MAKAANLLFLLFSAAVSPQTLFLHNNTNNNNNMDMEAKPKQWCSSVFQWCFVEPNPPGFYLLNFLQYMAVTYFEIFLVGLLVLPPAFFIFFLLFGLGTGHWEPFEMCLPKRFSKRSAYEEI